jgi:hypothetical protein
MAVAQLLVLSQQLHGGTEENQKNLRQDRRASNRELKRGP